MKPEIMKIHGLTSEEELRFLQTCCRRAPSKGKILEIGTFNGRSTAALCEAAGWKRVITVDSWKMQHHGNNSRNETRDNLDRLKMYPEIREGRSPLPPEDIPQQLALFFLDGHHHPETVTAELKAYTPRLLVGGMALMHDYGRHERYPGYSEAIHKFFTDRVAVFQEIGRQGAMIGFARK